MAGFVADPGTDFTSGVEREIARRLDVLAKHLGITIYGISGARTPAHSVAVGGFANDPHTKGQAADIAVNSQLRASASQLTTAQLASVGLTRPFAGASEINHVQLTTKIQALAGAGKPTGLFSPDPNAGTPLPKGGADAQTGGVAGNPTDPANLALKAINLFTGGFIDQLKKDAPKLMMTIGLVALGALLAFSGINQLAGGGPARVVKAAGKRAAVAAAL